MPNYKWLNVLAKVINGKTYIFCSCRDIYNDYSMGDTWNKYGKAAGLEAKKTEITRDCQKSLDPEVNCINLHQFQFVCNIQCKDKDECLELHRMVQEVFKRFYLNGFGGVAIPKFKIDKIEESIRFILLHCIRLKDLDLVYVLGRFDEIFRIEKDIRQGEVYIIDNAGKSTKVGLSNNPQKRLANLISAGELYQNATLYQTYQVYDVEGFESSAHALLHEYKYQNPLKSFSRNSNYGLLDEHYNCSPYYAEDVISRTLSAHYFSTGYEHQNEQHVPLPASGYYYETGNEKKDD